MAGGVPHAQAHRQLMRVMLHHEEYGATAVWSRMRQNVTNKMSETGLAYTYIELYLVIMYHLRANVAKKVHKGYNYAEFYEHRHDAHVRKVQTADDEAEMARETEAEWCLDGDEQWVDDEADAKAFQHKDSEAEKTKRSAPIAKNMATSERHASYCILN